MTREKLLNMYIKNCEANEMSENTIKEYVKHIGYFFEYIGDKKLEDVKRYDINTFRNDNIELSKSYRNVMLSAVKSFFDFLVNDIEYLENDVSVNVKPFRIKQQDVKKVCPLTKEQESGLLNNCKNSRDKAVIMSLLKLGLRISELINVTLDDYEFAKENEGELHIIGKGNKYRVVYINDDLFNVIDKYLLVRKDSEYDNLFISNGAKPLDRSCVSRTLKTIAKRSGRFTDEEIAMLHNHTMRHSFATNAVENGMSIDTVSRALGHSSIDTTFKIYVHQDNETLKKVFN